MHSVCALLKIMHWSHITQRLVAYEQNVYEYGSFIMGNTYTFSNYQVQNYSYTEELMYIAYMWGTQLQHPHNVYSR